MELKNKWLVFTIITFNHFISQRFCDLPSYMAMKRTDWFQGIVISQFIRLFNFSPLFCHVHSLQLFNIPTIISFYSYRCIILDLLKLLIIFDFLCLEISNSLLGELGDNSSTVTINVILTIKVLSFNILRRFVRLQALPIRKSLFSWLTILLLFYHMHMIPFFSYHIFRIMRSEQISLTVKLVQYPGFILFKYR